MKTYTKEAITTLEWDHLRPGRAQVELEEYLWQLTCRELWKDCRGRHIQPLIISGTLQKLPRYASLSMPLDTLHRLELQVTPMQDIIAPLLQLQQFAVWNREKRKNEGVESPSWVVCVEVLASKLIPHIVAHLWELKAEGFTLTGEQNLFLNLYLGKNLPQPTPPTNPTEPTATHE